MVRSAVSAVSAGSALFIWPSNKAIFEKKFNGLSIKTTLSEY